MTALRRFISDSSLPAQSKVGTRQAAPRYHARHLRRSRRITKRGTIPQELQDLTVLGGFSRATGARSARVTGNPDVISIISGLPTLLDNRDARTEVTSFQVYNFKVR